MGGVTEADPSTLPDADGEPREERDDASGVLWESAAASFQRWRGGEARAMDELVRTMTPILWQIVRSCGLDRALAEDVVQTTWMTLVRRHETVHDPRAVAGWLMTSARREAWRTARAQQRARPAEPADLELVLAADRSAEDVAHLGERDRRLWAALSRLDERCRRLLRIVAFEDRPDYARIARDMNMAIGSIGPTRGRCLGKLRTGLEASGWREDDRDR